MTDKADRFRHARPLVVVAMAIVALSLSLRQLLSVLPMEFWWQAISRASSDVLALILVDVTLPRIVVSCLVGAALGLSGTLLQQALRNPLADSTTMGVSSGAYLALTASSLFAPVLLDHGQEWVALTGASLATVLVLGLSARARFSVASLILAGLTISLMCGAIGAALTVMNHEALSSLFVWQTGSLVQNGWASVAYLVPRLMIAAIFAAILVRPLALFDLGDEQIRGLGLSAGQWRGVAVAVGVTIAAATVSAVGVIGFVGIAAPNLARLLGARTLLQRLLWAPICGALLLWLTDQLVQNVPLFRMPIPTGAAVALLGAPMLLWLLLRHREFNVGLPQPVSAAPRRAAAPGHVVAGATVLLVCCIPAALMFGRSVHGWEWLPMDTATFVMPWRWPRVAASVAAGAALAAAGALLQRITTNSMASPEVLGVSSGGALGVILLLSVVPDFSFPSMLAAAFGGSVITLVAIVSLNWRAGFSPERLLLAGIAIATMFSAFAAVLLTSGDPRSAMLLAWMSGSTFRTSADLAVTACIVVGVLLSPTFFMARWLDLLSLGSPAALSLGIPVARSRLAILLAAAGLTAVATLVVGPVSFLGLMAPHMARSLGVQRPRQHVAAAAALGALIMVAADWLGRNLLFPYQIPAGLLTAVVGGPYFLWLMGPMRRQNR